MARQRMAEVRAELAELEAAESFFEAPPDEEGEFAHLLEDILQMAGDDIGDFSDDPSKRTSAFTVDRPSSYTSEVTGASRPPSSPWREGPSSPWREENAPLVDTEG